MQQVLSRWFMVILIAAVPAGPAVAGDCPDELIAVSNRWETSPDFSGVGDISMMAEFMNVTGDTVFFDGQSQPFQIWTTPSIYDVIPVTINSGPVGSFADGASFSYDLIIHAGAFEPTEFGFAFRPQEQDMFGNLGPGRSELVSVKFTCTEGTGFQIDKAMTGSFFDPAFEGQGINTEVLTEPGVVPDPDPQFPAAAKGEFEAVPGLVVVYWYTFDLLGFPVFAFGVGEYTGDSMIIEMLIDYDGAGPFFGPGWNPDQFDGMPFATVTIIWEDCVNGVMTFVMDPDFDAVTPGFVPHAMNLERITNVLGVPCT